MKYIVKSYRDLCSLETFKINGEDAIKEEFVDQYDASPGTAEPYGCGCMTADVLPPKKEILEKYNITKEIKVMKILVKQTDILSATFWKGVIVEQFMVYLMDSTNRPLSCEIVYGKAAKNDLVNSLLVEHFIPTNWEKNKEAFDA